MNGSPAFQMLVMNTEEQLFSCMLSMYPASQAHLFTVVAFQCTLLKMFNLSASNNCSSFFLICTPFISFTLQYLLWHHRKWLLKGMKICLFSSLTCLSVGFSDFLYQIEKLASILFSDFFSRSFYCCICVAGNEVSAQVPLCKCRDQRTKWFSPPTMWMAGRDVHH